MSLTNAPSPVKQRADAVRELTNRVRAEYAEMPGLSITLSQAQRLWAVDRHTCEIVFKELLARRVLTMTPKGRFVRA
jgi:hypothetical protein